MENMWGAEQLSSYKWSPNILIILNGEGRVKIQIQIFILESLSTQGFPAEIQSPVYLFSPV